jgi:WD40 repeat protein
MKQQTNLRDNLRKILHMRGRYMALFALLLLAFSNMLTYDLHAESDTLWSKYIGSTVRKVKFSPDGRFVYAAVHAYGPLKLDANSGEILNEYQRFKYGDNSSFSALDVTKDGKYTVGGYSDTLFLYDNNDGKVVKTYNYSLDAVYFNLFTQAIVSNDNKYIIATVGYNHSANDKTKYKLCVWNMETSKLLKSDEITKGVNIEQMKDKNIFALSGYDEDEDLYDIKLIEIGTWKELGVLKGHQNKIADLSFSPDGSLLASRESITYLVKIWDTKKQELTMSFNPNGTYTGSLSLIDNNRLVSSSGELEDLRLRTHNLSTKLEISNILNKAGDFNFFENKFVVCANLENITNLRADKLSSIPFNIGKDKLFPNPANQNLTIPKSYFNENLIYIIIIDMSGKEVFRYNKTIDINFNEDMLVDVSRYLKGSYIVQFFYTTNIQTLKFIKE